MSALQDKYGYETLSHSRLNNFAYIVRKIEDVYCPSVIHVKNEIISYDEFMEIIVILNNAINTEYNEDKHRVLDRILIEEYEGMVICKSSDQNQFVYFNTYERAQNVIDHIDEIFEKYHYNLEQLGLI